MGEVMPNALHVMAKAAQDAGISVSGTYAELQKLQQQGKVVSAKVLPFFAKRMSEAARANGGLDKALLSNRVSMNRFMFSLQEAADLVFKSGFSKGLTEFFNETAEAVVELRELWQGLGKIFGAVFKIVAKVVEYMKPAFVALGSIINDMADALGDTGAALLALAPATKIFMTLGKRLVPIVALVTGIADAFRTAAFWAEELMNLFTGEKIGLLYDPRKNATGETKGFQGKGLAELIMESSPVGRMMKDFIPSPAFMGGQQQSLNIKTDVSIDGEKVVTAIASKPSFQNAVQESSMHMFE